MADVVAAIYCRTAVKGPEGDRSGVRDQERRCREYCAAQGYAVAGVFADDGYGGMSLERPGFREMFACLAEKRVAAIVATDHNRLSRRQADWRVILDELGRLGARVEVSAVAGARQ